MRLGRLANLLTVIGVVLALAGAATALAAARAPDSGTTAPAPVARSSVHSVMNAPEADGASGRAVAAAPRASPDPASTISETGIPRKAATPPDSPIASSFVKNGPAVAVAVLETVNPSVPVEGTDLRIGTAGAARDAAGRNGAGPVFQQAGITSYDITLKPGSNLISLTLMPDDTAIEAVLAGILDRVETVWQYDTSGPDPKWRSYAPGAPSDLRVMRDGPGYWVHLKDDGTGDEALTITGGDASGPARRVVQGWNLVGFTATTAGDAATDRAALVTLYNATDGANWANNDNWLSNAPMGEWRGVTTDSDGRVTRLDLPYNQLTGGIPAELGDLTYLRWLALAGNQLTGEIPAELGSLTYLTHLVLHNNQLTGGIPAELGNLAYLKYLDLSFNQLTGEIPAELGDLTKLTELSLHDNQLTGEIPAELGDLTKLTELSLHANQLTGEIPAELGSLTNLVRLALSGNRLTGGIPAWLGSLTNLVRLYLNDNQLTGGIPAELGSLTNLKWLYLNNNQLTGEIPAELGSLTYLTVLYLHNNQLTGCIPNGLRGIRVNDLSLLGLPFCGMPGAPTIATPIVPGDASLTVAWAAPINTGSSAITAYDLRYIETGAADKSDANWTVVEDVWAAGSGSLQYTLSGLTGGTQYDVQVRAVNAAGASAWSASVTGTPATWGAIRSFSPPSAALGGEVVVTVTASGYGPFGGVMETLPAGFSYVSSSLPDDSVTVNGQEVTFNLLGETDFTYTVAAPSAEGSYSFSGVLTNSDRAEVPVGGAITIAVTAGDPLIARYDANGNSMIERGEVIAAINDYLFGEGDGVISRSDVIRLINLYLFAPSTPHNRPGAPTGLTAVGNGQTRIDLSWSAPPSDGGSAITGYRIEVSENGSTWIDLVANTRNPATSYSHTGLTAEARATTGSRPSTPQERDRRRTSPPAQPPAMRPRTGPPWSPSTTPRAERTGSTTASG